MSRPSEELRQKVLAILRREQAAAHKVDREMAEELGVGQPMWSMMKLSRRSVSMDTMVVAAMKYATVRAAVLSFFARLGD